MADIKFTPWPEDEIIFKKGNWTIARADAPGLYVYSVDEIVAHAAVDAVQLVEWDMAEAVSYSALAPWEGSEIEFTGKAEILRDLADHTKQVAGRSYYVEVPGGRGGMRLQRVNRYYLVANGFATGSDAFKRHVLSLSLKKSAGIESWAQDEIVITPKAGYTIERGLSSGIYRVGQGGFKSNWDAARLLEEGLAISAYDAKLLEHAKSANARMSELKERFNGLWMAENADGISSLHEIAVLWRELEDNPKSPLLQTILAHNEGIRQAYIAAKVQCISLSVKVAEMRGKIQAFQSLYNEAKRFVADYHKYSNVTADELTPEIDERRERAEKAIGKLRLTACEVSTLIEQVKSEASEIKIPQAEPFELTVCPSPKSDEMRALYTRIERACSEIRESEQYFKNQTLVPDTTAWHAQVQSVAADIESLEADVKAVSETVQRARERKAKLDRLKENFGSAYRSHRVPLFQHPWKCDPIRFTTGVKIKHGPIESTYMVPDGNDFVLVHNFELIYLGLAKLK